MILLIQFAGAQLDRDRRPDARGGAAVPQDALDRLEDLPEAQEDGDQVVRALHHDDRGARRPHPRRQPLQGHTGAEANFPHRQSLFRGRQKVRSVKIV